MRSALLALIVVGALAPPAAADDEDAAITVTTSFALGSMKIGDAHTYQAPGSFFDLGFRVRRWRLAAEAQTGMWSEVTGGEDNDNSGGFTRLGMALRFNWRDLEMSPAGRPHMNFRGFVEVGLGRQYLDGPGFDLSRNDIMLGVGVAPEFKFKGRFRFGATFGIRMLVSRAPVTTIARGSCASCSDPGHDLALLYVFGFTWGR